ncbi:MAG: omptin family outer membrane protease [Treponema sp.]|jgi:outer membrane protease|nr:omptin family outer membrane protease [Treponema sp.]
MKTISLFGVFVISFSFLFTVSNAFGQVSSSGETEQDLEVGKVSFVISAEAKAGFIYGQGEELVYYGTTDTVLSQLLWDMKPLWYVGGDLALSLGHSRWPFNLKVFDFSVKGCLPLASGKMEDRDWLYRPYDNSPTLFSSHDNFTSSAIFLDVDFLDFSFPFSFSSVTLSGDFFFRYSYMDLTWTARDGYMDYTKTGGSKYDHEGLAIDYTQTWNLFALGVGTGISVKDIFFADVSFAITPLIFVTAEDHHHITHMQYQDKPEGGLYLEPKITLGLSTNKHFRFSVYFSYRHISGSKGESSSRVAGSGDYIKISGSTGGAAYRAMDSGIAIKVIF